jgi:hypothetical protein
MGHAAAACGAAVLLFHTKNNSMAKIGDGEKHFVTQKHTKLPG